MSQSLATPRGTTLTVIAFTSLAAIIAAVYLYEHKPDYGKEKKSVGLQRAGAIRRARRASPPMEAAVTGAGFGSDGAPVETPADTAIDAVATDQDDNETEHSIPDEDAEQVAENQHTDSKLKELTLFIAQNREIEEGIVHRGITCDSCGILPIRGVRYRCANCEDYDLCELCEATSEHVRSHIFYKIRVPCFWGPGKIEPVWFPGMPTKMPREVPNEVLQDVLKSLSCLSCDELPKEAELKGLYQQYACMADEMFPSSRVKHSICCGISRSAFRYLLPVTRRGALTLNRLFVLFDTDKDGLISFEEFVHGTILVNWRKAFPAWQHHFFKALDLDDDGFVSRQDLLQLYDDIHDINEDITMAHLRLYYESNDQRHVEANKTLRDFVDDARPLPNYFNSEYLDAVHNHRITGPVFGQLAGHSNLDDDDDGQELLFKRDSSYNQVVPYSRETPAARYIFKKLRSAFNELLDPIFFVHEVKASILKLSQSFLQHHATMIEKARRIEIGIRRTVNERERKNQAAGHSPLFAVVEDDDEFALHNIDWQYIKERWHGHESAAFMMLIKRYYKSTSQQQKLIRDVLAVAFELERLTAKHNVRWFQHALQSQAESSWNPLMRHNSFPIAPRLLARIIRLMVSLRMWQMFEPNFEQELRGNMGIGKFWKEVARAEKQGNEFGYYRDPLPLLDVMGLVVI